MNSSSLAACPDEITDVLTRQFWASWTDENRLAYIKVHHADVWTRFNSDASTILPPIPIDPALIQLSTGSMDSNGVENTSREAENVSRASVSAVRGRKRRTLASAPKTIAKKLARDRTQSEKKVVSKAKVCNIGTQLKIAMLV